MTQKLQKNSYLVADVRPYINWVYFLHAWGMTGKPANAQERLLSEAEQMLDDMESRHYNTHSLFRLCRANSDGDDLLLDDVRMPLLRQQVPDQNGNCLCLTDFVRPVGKGDDRVGVFATTVDHAMETDFVVDPYLKMMAQTIADRLAEATAELLHLEVRRCLWGYAPDENLSVSELHKEHFQGIRPAVGYPSIPDTSVNFILDRLLNMRNTGIWLTENGAMRPHASVSGLMISHPSACYFSLGVIGDDQLRDYAQRRGLPLVMVKRFLGQ